MLVSLWLGMGITLWASSQHHVVSMDGRVEVGTVLTLTDEVLILQSRGQETPKEMALDGILYVHNGRGKLFYVSRRLERFIHRAESRGGRLETVDGKDVLYERLRPEFFMYRPAVNVIVEGGEEWERLPLDSIHRMVVDRSLSQFAARNGFYSGAGISLLRLMYKFGTNRELSRIPTYVVDVYPGLVTVTPLAVLGWIVYDFFFADREVILNPIPSTSTP